ncbi:MAG: glycoside hydrolase family 16 protein [Bacteroidetes bacterium]|nr:glycoside hydrolase family 16 protein [Bacteroidota bacterium]
MKKIIFIFLGMISLNLKSQTPAEDESWELIFFDDFNGTQLNPAVWDIANENDNYADPIAHQDIDPGVSLMRNIEVANGELIITARKESYSCSGGITPYGCHLPNYDYTVGSVNTKNQNFYYGYYEARIKFDYKPGHHPAFWLLNHNGSPIYNEIDIVEIVCNQKKRNITSKPIFDPDSKMYVHDIITNTHGPGNPPERIDGGPDNPQIVYVSTYQTYHTYGLEWQPNKMIWYIDGIAVRNEKPNALYNSPMTVIFGNGVEGGVEKAALAYTPTYNYPAQVVVDYFKYYQLKGNCNIDEASACYNFNVHNDEVKHKYDLGNSCYNTVPAGKNYVFRASDHIELKDEFSVPLGSQFYADVDDYCQQSPYNTHNCDYIFEPCNFDFSGYNNSIKQTIEISGVNCNAIVKPTDNVKLYATEYIYLKEGVEIPLNSEIEIKTTICQ